MLPEIELNQEIQENIEESKKKRKFVMNRLNVQTALPNTIDVTNNEESYKKFFWLGGTVGKMSMASTKNYMKFKKARYEEKFGVADKKVRRPK